MGGTAVVLDFSKAQRFAQSGQGVTLDFSKAQRFDQSKADTGVWAGVKRNTVGMVQGLYHAFADPATDEEKTDLLNKVREDNQKYGDNIPEELATSPSKATLAYHRLIDAPASYLHSKGDDEEAAAKDLMNKGQVFKGANQYLSALTDKTLAAVPLAGPYVNSIAERYESGDVSGAATDIAAAWAGENAKPIIKKAGEAMPSAEDVGKTLRTPEGKLKPAVKVASKVAGAALGHASGVPGAGELGGYLLGPQVADLLIPEHPETATIEANKALAKEGKAVPITRSPNYDPAAYKAGRTPVKTATPPPSPFGNAMATDASSVSALPKASVPRGMGTLADFANPQPQLVSKFTPPEPSRIVSPASSPAPVNRTLVSYPRTVLAEMAKRGDLNALRELVRNPGEVDISSIPGARYLMELPTR